MEDEANEEEGVELAGPPPLAFIKQPGCTTKSNGMVCAASILFPGTMNLIQCIVKDL